LFKLQLDPDSK